MRALPGCGGPSGSACTPSMNNTLTAIVEPTSAITLLTLPPDPSTIVSSPDYPAPCIAYARARACRKSFQSASGKDLGKVDQRDEARRPGAWCMLLEDAARHRWPPRRRYLG